MLLYVTSIDGTKNPSHATQKRRGCNFGHFGMRPPWGRGMCAQGQLAVQMLAAARSRCNAPSAMPIDSGMCNATPDSFGLEGPGNLVHKKKAFAANRCNCALKCYIWLFWWWFGSGDPA
jgi:hypothetical protein